MRYKDFGSPAIGMICKKSNLPFYGYDCASFKDAQSSQLNDLTNALSFRLQDYRFSKHQAYRLTMPCLERLRVLQGRAVVAFNALTNSLVFRLQDYPFP